MDVIIPRGGKGLIERISREAKVPVIKHLDGNCHVYVDDPGDLAMAVRVVDNAKTQKYSPCNAIEGLLVARSVAGGIPAEDRRDLCGQRRGDAVRRRPRAPLARGRPGRGSHDGDGARLVRRNTSRPSSASRWWRAWTRRLRISTAIRSHHTDAIITRDHVHAQRFLREVDSASVMVNASTRFADGFEFGLGAEIGISTDKFHARGPVGIEGLTSLKWVVLGNGEIRS